MTADTIICSCGFWLLIMPLVLWSTYHVWFEPRLFIDDIKYNSSPRQNDTRRFYGITNKHLLTFFRVLSIALVMLMLLLLWTDILRPLLQY